MASTPCQTRYYVKTGREPGLTVVVIGGVHGDEPAGYLAARQLVHWKITRGILVVLPDAHKEAIRRHVRGYPGNMNRMFPGKADGNPMERLAFEIFEMVRRAKPNLLLTLHESIGFHRDDPKRYGQTFTFDFAELTPFMTKAMTRLNLDILQSRHKFSNYVDPFPTCPTYQAWAKLGTPATSIETCRLLPLNVRIKYQLMAVEAFLDEIGLGYDPVGVRRLSCRRAPSAAPSKAVAAPTARSEKSHAMRKSANSLDSTDSTSPASVHSAVQLSQTLQNTRAMDTADRGLKKVAIVRFCLLVLGSVLVGTALGLVGWKVWMRRREEP